MALIVPKFSYGVGPTTFVPTYPALDKPGPQDGTADQLTVQRVDSITMSGKKQVFYIRTDAFRTLKFATSPFTDFTGWSGFMAYAIQGGTFSYFPDSTLGTFTNYTLEDTDWKPSLAIKNYAASFTLIMRQLV